MTQPPPPSTRLRQARENAGYRTASEFAHRFNFTETLVRSNENGHRKLTIEQAKRYGKALNVSWLWLMEEPEPLDGNYQAMHPPATLIEGLPNTHTATNDTQNKANMLRVLGMSEGGSDGWNLFNGDVVQWVDMPFNLKGVPGAYAVYVRGDSMSPRYDAGEIVHIHPGKPVEPGSYVLVQKRNPGDEAHPYAIVKRLVRRTATKLVLCQLNPDKQFDLLASEVVSIHKIVGSGEA